MPLCTRLVKTAVFLMLLAVFSPGFVLGAQHARALGIAGLHLGEDFKELQQRFVMETRSDDDTYTGLTGYQLKPLPGFRSIYAYFGQCTHQSKLVRIKCNYEDDSIELFDKILKALKSRYGSPIAWRGDPFGNLKVWKWSLKDPDLGNISLILSYYPGDDDTFTKGISLRLAAQDFVDREVECQRAKIKLRMPSAQGAEPDFESLLPH